MSDTAQRVSRAAALLADQDIDAALETITEAAWLDPNSPQAAFGHAQIAFEAWQPAAALFKRAAALLPGQPDLIRNRALALAAEGEGVTAERLLEGVLAQHPGWIEGHRTLCAMRITNGESESWDRSFAAAAAREPANTAIWLSWFQQHATRKDWAAARKVLDRAQQACPPSQGLALSALFLVAESGEGTPDFAPFTALADPGTDLCHIRYLLRTGQPEAALAVAQRHLGAPQARMFWPYAGLCWRLLCDPQAGWLDGEPLHAAAIDLDFTPQELAGLAAALRSLHRMKAPYPEQSVRGGTQTDRQLFFHPDPAIRLARDKVLAAVAEFAAALPHQAGHPLLERGTGPLHFAGSWSVRLAGAGFHASHTHVRGWISSACYVSLPEPDELGAPPAGWLSLGSPPPELRLDLPPLRQIEPKPGRLALFGSTLWHATEPFAAGERLTFAFDVAPPS
jgi:Tfp pilus assembly protein PilF